MAQLRVTIRVLSAALLALLARIVVDGVTIADGLAEALIVVLLIASVRLWRYGRRLESGPPHCLSGGTNGRAAPRPSSPRPAAVENGSSSTVRPRRATRRRQ